MLTLLPHRAIVVVSGDDRLTFLQGLVTNDVLKLSPDALEYAAMLTPQGKIIADFLMIDRGREIWLECWKPKAEALLQKLKMFKLRAKVAIQEVDSIRVYHSDSPMVNAFTDPRYSTLGYRLYSSENLEAANDISAYTKIRLQHGVPESEDIVEDRSFPMEIGIPQLHGISYTKGCYVGQEVVARNKTRGTLHKAIHIVHSMDGSPLPAAGTPVLMGDAEVGILRTTLDGEGLAIVRIEAADKPLIAAGIALKAQLPDWFLIPTPVMHNL